MKQVIISPFRLPFAEFKKALGYGFKPEETHDFNQYTLRAVEAIAKHRCIAPEHWIHNLFSLPNPELYRESYHIATNGYDHIQLEGMAEFHLTPAEVNYRNFGAHTLDAIRLVVVDEINDKTPDDTCKKLVREAYEQLFSNKTVRQQCDFIHRHLKRVGKGKIPYIDLLHLVDRDFNKTIDKKSSEAELKTSYANHYVNYRNMDTDIIVLHIAGLLKINTTKQPLETIPEEKRPKQFRKKLTKIKTVLSAALFIKPKEEEKESSNVTPSILLSKEGEPFDSSSPGKPIHIGSTVITPISKPPIRRSKSDDLIYHRFSPPNNDKRFI